jgi:hypothetical protein
MSPKMAKMAVQITTLHKGGESNQTQLKAVNKEI